MVSKEFENLRRILKERKLSAEKKRVEEERRSFEQITALVSLPKDIKMIKFLVKAISCVWIESPNCNQNNVIFYLHGGGYITGSIDTNKDLVARIARVSESRVLFIEYRLAPEFPFPAALEDAISAYEWLINTEHISPNNIIFFGESAGGGLALSTLIKIKELSLQLPAAAILLSPWVDLDFTGDSIKNNAKIDPFITFDTMLFYARLYIGNNNPRDPNISPLYADLKDLPPLLIHVGSAELLLDDSRRLAEKAKISGVDVELEIWKDMTHVFHAFAGLIPEGQRAINKIGVFIRSLLN
ncbi:MAG: alpha/beta hydrolase [Promethearchaeota archaeon]